MSLESCPTHDVALISSKSGTQFLCPLAECDFYMKSKEHTDMSTPAKKSKSRTDLIAESVKKKSAPVPPAKLTLPAKKKPTPAPEPAHVDIEPDDDILTVSDVAAEVGIEPKVARQRLRKDGARAIDGRWPTVTRDSKEHQALVAKLTATPVRAKAAPAEGDDEPDTSYEEEE